MRTVSSDLSDEERTLALLRESARRNGLNPRSFFRLLSHAFETRAWEHLPEGPVTFLEFMRRAGFSEESLRAALNMRAEQEDRAPDEHERFEETRRQARHELDSELAKHGEVGKGRPLRDSNTTSKGRGETYARRRLRRDRPDLYDLVAAGQLSAHRAAVTAGFRKETATIPIDNADTAIKALLRRFSKDELLTALNGEP